MIVFGLENHIIPAPVMNETISVLVLMLVLMLLPVPASNKKQTIHAMHHESTKVQVHTSYINQSSDTLNLYNR